MMHLITYQYVIYLKKDYDKGWFYHESRFYLNNFGLLRQINNNFKKPRWDQSRPKKNILIWESKELVTKYCTHNLLI